MEKKISKIETNVVSHHCTDKLKDKSISFISTSKYQQHPRNATFHANNISHAYMVGKVTNS